MNLSDFEEYLKIVKKVAEAWNEHDIDLLLNYVAEDIYWDDPAMDEPACGHAMLKEFALPFWQAFPDVRYEPLQEVFLSPGEAKLAHKFTISGTWLGRLQPGFSPTGRKFKVDGLEMMEFREHKLYKCITRIDGISVAEQIGLLPPRLKSGTWKTRFAIKLQSIFAWHLRRMNQKSNKQFMN